MFSKFDHYFHLSSPLDKDFSIIYCQSDFFILQNVTVLFIAVWEHLSRHVKGTFARTLQYEVL